MKKNEKKKKTQISNCLNRNIFTPFDKILVKF
mgnify:CR=1 FL=1